MNRGIYPVVAGAITQERQLEVLAHNLGNIHTSGFKKDDSVFGTILARSVGRPVAGFDLFPQVATVRPDTSQGTLKFTGHDMDVGLQGDGYLVVSTSDGLRHFRGGQLKINPKGELATQLDDPVLGVNGPIKVPAGTMNIDRKGIVNVEGRQVGQLRIENLLPSIVPVKSGDRYWQIPQQVVEAKNVEVFQASLEQANVNPSMELVNMIKVTRAYEQMQKAIQSMDEMTERMIQSANVQ
jgi:flagellar basal-body rod protein FlgF